MLTQQSFDLFFGVNSVKVKVKDNVSIVFQFPSGRALVKSVLDWLECVLRYNLAFYDIEIPANFFFSDLYAVGPVVLC